MEESTKKRDGDRREFWEKHISSCRESGLSYAGYCRGHDLSESTFSYWRRRLSDAQKGQPALVELKVSEGKDNGIEVILRNRMRLAIHSNFDAAVLKKLIGVLERL